MIFLSLHWLLHVRSAVNRSCLITSAPTAEHIRGGRWSLLKKSLRNYYSTVTNKRHITTPSRKRGFIKALMQGTSS